MKQDRRLPLSDGGYELLKTVHTLPGAYSEIFFITEMGSGIGRLIVDPYKRILFSTKPEDVNALKQLRRQGLSLGDAIQQLIDNRSSKSRRVRMDPKSQWLSTVLISLFLGSIGGWLAAQQQLQQPLARLNLVTPVFVLDRGKLIQSIPPNASQEQMAKIVDDWQGQAKSSVTQVIWSLTRPR